MDSVAASKRKRTRYVKGYHNKGYDNLIVESLLKKDTSLLNKNIKLKYNKSRIKQINI